MGCPSGRSSAQIAGWKNDNPQSQQNPTTIKYKWNTNKRGEYTTFAAFIKTGSTTLEAHYRPKKNQTIIMTKPTDFDDTDSDDADNRPIKAKLPGFVVPGIQTEEGSVNIIY